MELMAARWKRVLMLLLAKCDTLDLPLMLLPEECSNQISDLAGWFKFPVHL